MWFTRGALALIMASASLSAFALSYTFDTDNQGWMQADFNSSTLALTPIGPANWAVGGFLEEVDFSNWAFDISPVLSGGYQGSTTVSFDLSIDDNESTAFPLLVLASPTEAVYRSEIPPADGAFHNYSYDLTDPTGWLYSDGVNFRAANQADITNVLTSLVVMGIDVDMNDGPDHTRIDNVNLGVVPEPFSLAALAVVPVLARKRRRKV